MFSRTNRAPNMDFSRIFFSRPSDSKLGLFKDISQGLSDQYGFLRIDRPPNMDYLREFFKDYQTTKRWFFMDVFQRSKDH